MLCATIIPLAILKTSSRRTYLFLIRNGGINVTNTVNNAVPSLMYIVHIVLTNTISMLYFKFFYNYFRDCGSENQHYK